MSVHQPYRGRTPGAPPPRLQRVLVATLLDVNPLPEVEIAATLARPSNGSVFLLDVLEALMYAPLGAAERDAGGKDAIHPEASRKMARGPASRHGPRGVDVEGKIEFGIPSDVIVHMYVDLGQRFDVLVLGTRGRAGSVLRRVVEHTRIPVMLAPHPGE